MNERILQLAKQAGVSAQSETTLHPNQVKFAELIVRECIGILNRRYMGDNNREDFEVRRCVEDLKKHFGIKDENSKITDEEWYWAIK